MRLPLLFLLVCPTGLLASSNSYDLTWSGSSAANWSGVQTWDSGNQMTTTDNTKRCASTFAYRIDIDNTAGADAADVTVIVFNNSTADGIKSGGALTSVLGFQRNVAAGGTALVNGTTAIQAGITNGVNGPEAFHGFLALNGGGPADFGVTSEYEAVCYDTATNQVLGTSTVTLNHLGNVNYSFSTTNVATTLSAPEAVFSFDLSQVPSTTETPVIFTLNTTNFTDSPQSFTVHVNGVDLGGGSIAEGSEFGTGGFVQVEATSIGGSLHGASVEWRDSTGTVVAIGTSPPWEPTVDEFGNEVGNPFEFEMSYVLLDVGEDDTDDDVLTPDDFDYTDSWTEPDPGGDGVGPAGDPGNPVGDDNSKADNYDAFKAALEDASGNTPSPPDTSAAGVLGGLDPDPFGSADLAGKGDQVTTGISGITSGLEGAIPAAPALPSVSGNINSWTMNFPIMGTVTLDLSQYDWWISPMRAFFAFVLGVVTWVSFVAILRGSSAG